LKQFIALTSSILSLSVQSAQTVGATINEFSLANGIQTANELNLVELDSARPHSNHLKRRA
jgi:hypothetical protein